MNLCIAMLYIKCLFLSMLIRVCIFSNTFVNDPPPSPGNAIRKKEKLLGLRGFSFLATRNSWEKEEAGSQRRGEGLRMLVRNERLFVSS